MKLIVAIIRPEKLSDTLEALYRAEVRGFTVTRVQGHGGELEPVQTYRGTTVKMELQEKIRLEIGVSDSFVEVTVQAILRSAGTGVSRRFSLGDWKQSLPSGIPPGSWWRLSCPSIEWGAGLRSPSASVSLASTPVEAGTVSVWSSSTE